MKKNLTLLIALAGMLVSCEPKSEMGHLEDPFRYLDAERYAAKVYTEENRAAARVEFMLTKEELSYYNHDLQWVCEPGDFEIMVGPNSRDTESVMLTLLPASIPTGFFFGKAF